MIRVYPFMLVERINVSLLLRILYLISLIIYTYVRAKNVED